MRIFFYYSPKKFINSYLVGNEKTGEAIFIDPIRITIDIIENISHHKYKLKSVLFTHTDKELQLEGLHTIMKIYNPKVIGVAPDLKIENSVVIKGDGIIDTAGFKIRHFSVQGLAAGAYMFQIENVVFSGAAIRAGEIGETSNIYAVRNLQRTLFQKIFNQNDEIIIMPELGPPTSIGSERLYNNALKKKHDSPRNSLF
ncbi:MAG: MBL fold metallo-hydrolase [Treponema sp.]|nr:MAG: MBL fold metallo-hydrolase [Treponema sp.]